MQMGHDDRILLGAQKFRSKVAVVGLREPYWREISVKRKTRKKLKRLVRRAMRAQGPDIAIGLVTGIVTNYITDRWPARREDSARQHAES